MDDPELVAADLMSLARSSDEGGSPLETLWAQTPGIIASFYPSDDAIKAARAYLYAAESWLQNAKALLPQVAGNASTFGELSERIAVISGRVSILKQLGYSAGVDGITDAMASLVRLVHDWTPGKGTLFLGGAAVLVIALLVLIVVLK